MTKKPEFNLADYSFEEMYSDWLWDKTYDELWVKAVKNVERNIKWYQCPKKEVYFKEHKRLFWEFYNKLKKQLKEAKEK